MSGRGAGYRVDARIVQDLPDRRVSDVMAESGQFTLDALMAPPGVSPGESQHE
jgi:hypothetical protein